MVSPLLRLLGRQTFRYDDAEADNQHQDKYGDQGQNPCPLPPGRIPVPGRARCRHYLGRIYPGQYLSKKKPALHHANHGRKDCRSYNHTHQMGGDLDGMDEPHGTVHYLQQTRGLLIPPGRLLFQLPFVHILYCRTKTVKHCLQKNKSYQYEDTDRWITIVHNDKKTPFILMKHHNRRALPKKTELYP